MVLNSFQEPLAESEDITGVVLPGLRLDGLRQQPRQRHRNRFSIFKGKEQGFWITVLVEKFQLYCLAVIKRFARRELAAASDHGCGRRPSARSGFDSAAMLKPIGLP